MTLAQPQSITLEEFLKFSWIEDSPAWEYINGDIAGGGVQFAPPWVIEILSPDQSQTGVTGNILHCLQHGSRLAWLLDPAERSILVY